MKILCLILASDTAPEYIQFQALWRRFMKKNRNVDCFFYKGHPDLTQKEFLLDDTLWIKVPETLDTVYEKTLRAFEYFVPRLKDYDFVFRSNLSTFVSFDHMIEFCNDLPRRECCAGVIGGLPPEDEERNSIEHGCSFPAGNGILLTPDLVERLVIERHPLVIQDDVTIGVTLRKWNISIREFARADFRNDGYWVPNNLHLLKPHEQTIIPKKMMFTYRIKSFNRQKDIQIFDSLIRKTYAA